MTPDEHIAAITEDGKKSWLIINGQRYDFDPLRDGNHRPLALTRETFSSKTPMDRFAFQVDGFTQWDAEIVPEGLRVLSNSLLERTSKRSVDEDDAFRHTDFYPNSVITWTRARQAIREYISLSCQRLNGNLEEIKWKTPIEP